MYRVGVLSVLLWLHNDRERCIIMVYAIVFPLLIVLYVISLFVPFPFMHYSVGIISVVVIMLTAIRAKGLYFYTGLVFLTIGVYLFIVKGLPWHTFFLQFQTMLGLLGLFTVLLFMNMLIFMNRFHKTIEGQLKLKTTSWHQLYKRSSMASQIIANFLNIGTIPLVAKSLKPSLSGFPEAAKHSFNSKSILRSYALALSWSPLDAAVSTAIDITGANFLVVLPILLGLAVVTLLADMGLSYFRYRKLTYLSNAVLQEGEEPPFAGNLFKLAVFLLLFVVVVSGVQMTLGQSFLISIVLVLPLYCLVWSLVQRKLQRYLALISGNWVRHTGSLSNYFFMFLCGALFVNMVSDTEGVAGLHSFFQSFIDVPFYFYLLTAAYFLVVSLIGFHPLVSLTVFAAITQSILEQLSVIPFTVVLIACCMSTIMYSPFNLSVSLMAKELNINPYRITIWNLAFALGYIFAGISIAMLLDIVV
jgi:hypothetical protein